MAIRGAYQDIYLISTSAGISTSKTFAVSEIGTELNVFNLVPTNKPDLAIGVQIADTPKATGLSERRTGSGYEYVNTIRQPICSGLTVEMNRKNLGLFLWLMFQKGCNEAGSTPYKKTAIPYTDSECETWCSIARLLDSGAASHQIDGAIIKSLTISGSGSSVITLSADFIGCDHSTAKTLAPYSTAISAEVPVRMQDITFSFGGESTYVDSFDLTITNNAESKFYGQGISGYKPTRHVLGKLDVSGSIKLPWSNIGSHIKNVDIDNFVAGTDVLLLCSIGTPSSNEILIKVNMRYSGDPTLDSGSQEIITNLPFVGAYDGTNHSIEITCEDAVNRGIPA